MSIDITAENLISLADAARSLPNKPSPATIWRWYTKGVRGILLQTVVCGGRRFTSREALQRFCDELTAPRHGTEGFDANGKSIRTESTTQKLKRVGLMVNPGSPQTNESEGQS